MRQGRPEKERGEGERESSGEKEMGGGRPCFHRPASRREDACRRTPWRGKGIADWLDEGEGMSGARVEREGARTSDASAGEKVKVKACCVRAGCEAEMRRVVDVSAGQRAG